MLGNLSQVLRLNNFSNVNDYDDPEVLYGAPLDAIGAQKNH